MSPIRLRVQELREARQWSQRDLARIAGVRQATISQAESGGAVTLAVLERLADALEVDAGYLLVHTRTKKSRAK